jgi:hypothetical protein
VQKKNRQRKLVGAIDQGHLEEGPAGVAEASIPERWQGHYSKVKCK